MARNPSQGAKTARKWWGRGAAATAGVTALAGVLTLGTSCAMLTAGGSGSGAGGGIEPARESEGRATPHEMGSFSVYASLTGPRARAVDMRGLPIRRSDVVLLYEHQVGHYPRIWKGKAEHGGTPVGLDLVAHTRKLRTDIERLVPDPAFDGMVVIDFESRPLRWDKLTEAYRDIVYARIRSVRAGIGEEELEELSEEAYNAATRRYMEVTIELIRSMRPRAQLGKYWFPKAGMKLEELGWLADRLDFTVAHMYPYYMSVSGSPENRYQKNQQHFVQKNAREIAAAIEFSRGEKPVIGFARPVYHEGNQGYGHEPINDIDGRTLVLRAEEAGLDGLVFWLYATDDEEQAELQEGMRKLGPLFDEAIRRRNARLAADD